MADWASILSNLARLDKEYLFLNNESEPTTRIPEIPTHFDFKKIKQNKYQSVGLGQIEYSNFG
jgi:hypothetical protein